VANRVAQGSVILWRSRRVLWGVQEASSWPVRCVGVVNEACGGVQETSTRAEGCAGSVGDG